MNNKFWKNKKVFITGHTGFKGGWLTIWLQSMGASVIGYSLAPKTDPNFFDVTQVNRLCTQSYIDDVRELDRLRYALIESKSEVVIHMAAQPLVRLSYDEPVETYSTNVMGTVNLLEAIRSVESVRAVVIVTTDKCYENKEWVWGYRENDSVGGRDPYSSSKSCVELVTAAYYQSFFSEKNYLKHGVAIASARAGNVIGGGDWSKDRIIPDCIRALQGNRAIILRQPGSTRPWQHVLEPLGGYLTLAAKLYDNPVAFSGSWNFGPKIESSKTVEELSLMIIKGWGSGTIDKPSLNQQPHEANLLQLNCDKSNILLQWKPKWDFNKTVKETVKWYKDVLNNKPVINTTRNQIIEYMEE